MALNFNLNNITSINYNGNAVSTVNFNGTEVWTAGPVIVPPFYIENRDSSNSITTKLYPKSAAPTVTLEYSLDNDTWTSYTVDDDITVPASGKCYFRAPAGVTNQTFGKDDSNYNTFTASGPYNVGGDITTLLTKDGGVTSLSGYGQNSYYCFFNLFGSWNISPTNKIVDASKLILTPTTLTGINCYKYMFYRDTNLVKAPALPATTLAKGCYEAMFVGCTSLTKAPALPVTTLTEGCYYNMFDECTSLKVAPELPATTLVKNCYWGMFYGCTNLQYVKANFSAWNDNDNSTRTWLSTITQEILQLELPNIGSFLDQPHNVSHVPTYCDLKNSATYSLPLTFVGTTMSGGIAQLKLQANGSPSSVDLEYKVNSGSWTSYTIGDTIQIGAVDQYIQFRAGVNGNATFSTGGNDNYQFIVEAGQFKAIGNIMSLLDQTMQSDTVPSNAFYNLFYGFDGQITSVRLPATDLNSWCYTGLFRASSNSHNKRVFTEYPSTYIPERAYQTIYMDDAYLKFIPEFSATSGGSNCLMRTFQNCTSIDMDSYKIKLTSVPYRGMYEMFKGAGTIRNFELMATELGGDRCLGGLFQSANPLSIKVHFEDWYWNYYSTDNWVSSIITDTSDCTFTCPTALGTESTIDRGVAKCPSNWTVVNY